MSHNTLESFLAEIFGCPIHGKLTEKSDSEASSEPTKVSFKLKDEAEKSKPQITLRFQESDGEVSIVAHDGKKEKTILFFNSEGSINLCRYALLDGLKTDADGYVKIKNLENIVRSKYDIVPLRQPKHPSVNGVEIWTIKDRDGAVQIRGKDESGVETLIAWIETDGKLNRSIFSNNLKGISTDGNGKIQMAN